MTSISNSTSMAEKVCLVTGAICISPWTDLALSGAPIQSRAKQDPILDPDSLRMYAAYYAGDQDI